MQHYEGRIRGWCRREGLRNADEDEVTQLVLAKLVEKMPQFVYDPAKGRFRDWLGHVVHNAVADYWRRAKRRPGDRGSGDTGVREALEAVPDPIPPDTEELVQELAPLLDHHRRVSEACERVRMRVADRTWRAFWLTAVEGLKGAEVKDLLGMEITAVHMAKSRVLKMIRDEIGPASTERS